MPRNSFAKITRGLRMKEYIDTLEQLSLEKMQLAEFLAQETGLDFDQAMNIVLVRCDELLPGYRGIDKLFIFRRRIRDRIMDAVRDQRENEEFEDWLDHEATISDARNAGCP